MKNIKTLIPDIYSLVSRKDGWFDDIRSKDLGANVASRLMAQFSSREDKGSLRLSKMGDRCPRALWYSVHHPELAEPFQPWTEIKFGYGHILEAYALTLAKASGHSVEGEQDELILDGVVGHRDCVLDGYIVDVKSCNSRVFNRFKTGTYDEVNMFGYLDQLDGYTVASSNDPLVRFLDKAYILAVDQVLGHLYLYEHEVRHEQIRERIRTYREYIQRTEAPDCSCGTRAFGESGNRSLDTKASYSLFKHCCFPTLRTFIYSDGPVYLTKVVRKPDVPELNKEGKIICRL